MATADVSSSSNAATPAEDTPDQLDMEELRAALIDAVLQDDCTNSLWKFYDSGTAALAVPELAALVLEQDPIHKHKDVLAHTIAVTSKTQPELVIRLAALFHDIGKPATRSFEHGGVTFRHHEAVGAKITKKRMRALGFEPAIVRDVAELVRLSGRFKGYADGWSDSAVRRYARDAGHLLGHLNELVRCDCTTRNLAKEARLMAHIDDLEERIILLAQEDARARERPQMDGNDVMEYLGISGGPMLGKALKHLLEVKRIEGDLPQRELEHRLDAWWAKNNTDRPRGG